MLILILMMMMIMITIIIIIINEMLELVGLRMFVVENSANDNNIKKKQ